MVIETEDKLANARNQALAQFDSIREMVAALLAARDAGDDEDDARRAIKEDALSIEVRGDWYVPGNGDQDAQKPTAYRILLCTGGPAVQIIGELNEYGAPETATLQCQDWFTPWAEVTWSELGGFGAKGETPEDVLLEYARCFYFAE